MPILGTAPEAIALAEDRGKFGEILSATNLKAPAFGTAFSYQEALEVAQRIGYPVLVRPSFVLGGRGMQIVYDDHHSPNTLKLLPRLIRNTLC